MYSRVLHLRWRAIDDGAGTAERRGQRHVTQKGKSRGFDPLSTARRGVASHRDLIDAKCQIGRSLGLVGGNSFWDGKTASSIIPRRRDSAAGTCCLWWVVGELPH